MKIYFRLPLIRASFLFLVLLFNRCQDGDPGPAGTDGTNGTSGTSGSDGSNGVPALSKNFGSISGTITGTRITGTPFTEAFTFDLAQANSQYYQESGVTYLNLQRSGNTVPYDNTLNLHFEIENGQLKIVADPLFGGWHADDDTWISFLRESAPTEAVMVRALPNFNRTLTVKWPINPTLNASQYDIEFGFNGAGLLYTNKDADTQTIIFRLIHGGQVVFNYTSGKFVNLEDADGNVTTDSPLYKALTYDNANRIFRDAGNNDLSSSEIIPADKFIISNYSYNKTTGALVFDFQFDVAGVGRLVNSTRHRLTVSGKVNTVIAKGIPELN